MLAVKNLLKPNLYVLSLKRVISKVQVNPEVEHHGQLANEWWEKEGPMRALHALNAIRVPFIRDGLISCGHVNKSLLDTPRVLENQKLLEVGCGGGILTEQLARLGANVTGIDLSDALIQTAREHIQKEHDKLKERICYKIEPIDVHAQTHNNHYDAVVVSEVLEHIDNKAQFLDSCVKNLRPGGSIFITTINQTWPMWLGGVVLGEYVLNIAPRGTHHWHKMIKPIDVQRILDTLLCTTVLVNGSTYDFWSNKWRWIDSNCMCYALQAIKQ